MVLIVIVTIQAMIILISLSRINYLENNFNHYKDWKIAEDSVKGLQHEEINK